MGGGLVATSGEVRTESPFAVLGRLNGTTKETGASKALRAIKEKEEDKEEDKTGFCGVLRGSAGFCGDIAADVNGKVNCVRPGFGVTARLSRAILF